jgi:hypothetical protein
MSAANLSGPKDRSMTPAMRASRVLGWVSFAIGAAELIAPKKVAKAVGMNEERTGLLRAYGLREILAGVGSHSVYPVPALWSRVAGDLLDIATVAMAADRNEEGSRSRNTWIAIAFLASVTLIDAMVATRMASETKEGKGEVRDYGDRTGFPAGGAARGAGIVRDAFDGKAGGAAAGDSSPAGLTQSGRSATDLVGAPAGQQHASGPVGAAASGPVDTQGQTSGGSGGSGSQASGAASSAIIGSGQTVNADAERAIPQPPSYSPA